MVDLSHGCPFCGPLAHDANQRLFRSVTTHPDHVLSKLLRATQSVCSIPWIWTPQKKILILFHVFSSDSCTKNKLHLQRPNIRCFSDPPLHPCNGQPYETEPTNCQYVIISSLTYVRGHKFILVAALSVSAFLFLINENWIVLSSCLLERACESLHRSTIGPTVNIT